MNILLAVPGHLRTVPMGRFTAEALRELGHRVTVFDYRASLSDKLWDRIAGSQEEKARTNSRLRRAVGRYRPDLFLTLFGFDVSVESLAYLRTKGIPTVCWWINDPFQYDRSLKKAPSYDFVFSNSAVCAERYSGAGVAHAGFLPTACVPAIHKATPLHDAYRCDVCFAGDWSPLRERLMERLAQEFDVRIFGPWAKKLKSGSPLAGVLVDGFFTPDEMARMFSSAAVVMNIHTWFEQCDHGVNPRLFEAAGCAAYQIVDWKVEVPRLFDLTSEIACYKTLDEVPELVRDALRDNEAARAVGFAAQRRAYGEHTYRNRMETLLETVGRAGA